MTLPNFLIVGAQKAGTTSLHDILSKHPQANMSKIKEVNYFTYKKNFDRGLKYYESFFYRSKSNHIITGEASPGYMCFPKVPQRINDNIGEVKIVMILRDPIKRAFSQYWDNRRHLSEYLDEEQIVTKYLKENYEPGERGYFSRGVYFKYIDRYRCLFGDKNIHIVILEELIKYPEKNLHKLYKFLGIDEKLGIQEMPIHSNYSKIYNNPFYLFFLNNPTYNKYLPKRARKLLFWGPQEKYDYKLPSNQLLNKIIEFYRPWNKKLEQYLGKEVLNWMK